MAYLLVHPNQKNGIYKHSHISRIPEGPDLFIVDSLMENGKKKNFLEGKKTKQTKKQNI